MRAILTSDLHISEKRLDIYERLLDDITTLALHHRCKHVFVAGDVWDEKSGVRTKVLNLLHRKLAESKAKGVVWVLLRGNHEIEVKSKPHVTLLSLFSEVACVVNRPTLMTFDGVCVAWMPWYFGSVFKAGLTKLAHRARLFAGKKILIAHIGIDEGKISDSNYFRVPQNVRLADLHPDVFDLTTLGDYHLEQQFPNNTLYLGCPIPNHFGDAPSQGVWLLEANDQKVSLTGLSLLFTYPEFHTWVIKDADDLTRVMPTAKDRHKLKIPMSLMPLAQGLAKLPNFSLDIQADPKEAPVTLGRLESVDRNDFLSIIKEWAKVKQLGPEYVEEGQRWIRRAQEMSYGK